MGNFFRKKRHIEAEAPAQGVGRLLLSALEDPDNPGLHPVNPNPSESFHLLGDGALDLIVGKLSGDCTRRESLPTVLAQEELFKLCIQNYGERKDEGAPAIIVEQWKGAVAARLLDEDIFLFSPIEKKAFTFTKPAAADAPGKKNAAAKEERAVSFRDCVCQSLGDEEKTWVACCVLESQMNRRLPLYQESDDLIAIPAANLSALPRVKANDVTLLSVIPWLTSQDKDDRAIRFRDPLPYLEKHQLKRLCDHLKQFQTDHPDSRYKMAMERFQEEILLYQKTGSQELEKACRELEEKLFFALSLRDALKCTLTVKEHRGQFYVLYKDTPLVSLSESELFVPHHPCAYFQSELQTELYSAIDEALQHAACYRRAQSVAEKWLRRGEYRIARAVRDTPERKDAAQGSEIPVMLKPRYFDQPDCQLPEPFSDFNYQAVPALRYPKDFYAQWVMLFTPPANKAEAVSLYHLADRFHEWYTVYDANDADAKPKPSQKQALLPLGTEGAHCLLPGGAYHMSKNRSENISVVLEQSGEAIRIRISFVVDGATYSLSHSYENRVHEVSRQDALTVGVWPDYIEDNRGQSLWNKYYTYLYYPDKKHTYHARAHYADGGSDQQGQVKEMSYAFGPFHALDNWSIIRSPCFPLFIELIYDNDIVGVMPCFPRSTHQCNNTHALLAIDFGMSATVSALVPNDANQKKDSQLSGGFTGTSDIQWQFNPEVGIGNVYRHFIGEFLGVTGEKNANGSMFTLVRRFDTDNKPGADHLRPYDDGNIEFVGDENIPTYDSHVFAGLKMANQSERRNAHAGLFLRQALEMYFYRCCQEGATSVDVRFAYPIAMDTLTRDLLSRQFSEICGELSRDTGLKVMSLSRTSESRAVQTYFHKGRSNDRMDIAWGSTVVTMDIGGGTTDFSIMRQTKDPARDAIADYHSTTLAGNAMFAHRLFDNPAFTELKERLDKEAAEGSSSERDAAGANDADAANEALYLRRQHFCLLIDQKLRLGDEELSRMIRDEQSAIHQPLIFQLCLLFWYATMLYRKAQPELAAEQTARPQLFICVAGNGSSFYRCQSDEIKAKIQKTIGITNVRLQFKESSEQKMEVVHGLLLMDKSELDEVALQDAEPSASNQSKRADNQQPASPYGGEKICDAFFAFLRQYVKQFSGDACIGALVADNARKQQLRAEMLDRVTNLDELAEYLPKLCDKLEIAGSARP